MTIEEINRECKVMQEFLETTASDDPDELVQRLTDINVYLARSSKLLADAKLLQSERIRSEIDYNMNTIRMLSATLAKKYVDTLASEESHAVDWLDRLNRSFVHVGDNIRTQISFAKEQLKLTRSGY